MLIVRVNNLVPGDVVVRTDSFPFVLCQVVGISVEEEDRACPDYCTIVERW